MSDMSDGSESKPKSELAVGPLTPGLLQQIEANTFVHGITPRQVRCEGCNGWLRIYADGYVSRRYCQCPKEGANAN
jgi:hypothetical protein